ncbi:hypothetical protein [Cellulomonas hominis]
MSTRTTGTTSTTRTHRSQALGPAGTERLGELGALALRGLPLGYLAQERELAQTVRAVRSPGGVTVRAEGRNPRYTAIVALGLSRWPEADQRAALGDTTTAAGLAVGVAARTSRFTDPGAVALAVWAAAEVADEVDPALLDRLVQHLGQDPALPTVDTAWMLTAALAAGRVIGWSAQVTTVVEAAHRRLREAQGPQGLFPHALPAASLGRWRAHVGCFADQVYPIQALARLAAATGDRSALEAADRCAARIVELQGAAGQWWWHYDARDGTVVEGFPVYSVHQHAMAPMALLDLHEAGGADHTAAVGRGLDWLDTHPEVLEELVSPRYGLVWRKVGRREPPKAARKLSAVTTSLSPGLRLPGLDAVLPPTVVDHECRPYEMGWLLYAWWCGGVVRALAPGGADAPGTDGTDSTAGEQS